MHYYQTKAECFASPYEREDENPELVKYVDQLPEGAVFQIFGRTYRRQSDFKQGDTVLYILDSIRTYLGESGSLLIEGQIVSRRFRGLRFARVRSADGFIESEFYAAGGISCLMMQNLPRSDKYIKRTPVGVMLDS
ncbi:MAG: hypothetical protein LUE11_06025 [Clostridia bacterium]|nr:hypothetical protein [Clostridia bacterium]